ncbi:hypothetical protein ESY86_06585 [Subsaximicrobium wynnwilliamsii]|uniref:DUF2846 domain-containing protein n=1 Tax=Subsaximicrobium wynnwilliamsii TaxID=291179 RepID=A0A5C6ZKJ1_9FLAO|nr:hypothetical protein [Subsaximicrobium wynnwilliamsii]TXD84243.1 hypothetical protein ESY87_07000 [Subsaximicrobium wynnwilliamsii]TXD89864.1 hypothetical protein ESY86_06585 [Subsaximicrobium wynnwilliamsii]TXE03955.1 hypothetical protein ESY88_06995 [Subsaximicrobium wynnwilliamsii]
MKNTEFLLAFLAICFLTSCGLKPIASEYSFIKTDMGTVDLEGLGNGTVLIYNAADMLHKIDNTARLNVWIDEKPMGQIKPSEYVIINLKNGNHQFKLLHKDVVNMRSDHEVQVSDSTKVIRVKPNIASNKLEVTNELPLKFEKFKYAEN